MIFQTLNSHLGFLNDFIAKLGAVGNITFFGHRPLILKEITEGLFIDNSKWLELQLISA